MSAEVAGSGNTQTTAVPIESSSLTSDNTAEQQQSHLKRHSSQIINGRNQPSSKKHRAASKPTPGPQKRWSHQLVVLHDGAKRVEMDAELNRTHGVRIPLAFARASFSQYPVSIQTKVAIDGVLQDSEASCRITQCTPTKGLAFPVASLSSAAGKYHNHRVTCLEIDCNGSQLTMYLQSPAAQQQAAAEAAAAAQAEAVAAAAAAASGSTFWYEHKGTGQPLPSTQNKKHMYLHIPPAFMSKVFGTSLASPFEAQLTVYKNDELIGDAPKRFALQPSRWRCVMNQSLSEQLLRCQLVKYRAAAPNLIEVYFSSTHAQGQISSQPAATPVAAGETAAAGSGDLNGSCQDVALAPSTPAAATAAVVVAPTAPEAIPMPDEGPDSALVSSVPHAQATSPPAPPPKHPQGLAADLQQQPQAVISLRCLPATTATGPAGRGPGDAGSTSADGSPTDTALKLHTAQDCNKGLGSAAAVTEPILAAVPANLQAAHAVPFTKLPVQYKGNMLKPVGAEQQHNFTKQAASPVVAPQQEQQQQGLLVQFNAGPQAAEEMVPRLKAAAAAAEEEAAAATGSAGAASLAVQPEAGGIFEQLTSGQLLKTDCTAVQLCDAADASAHCVAEQQPHNHSPAGETAGCQLPQQQLPQFGLNQSATQPIAATTAMAAAPQTHAAAAAADQDSNKYMQLGLVLQPFKDVVQAFEQLTLLLQHLTAPDELMQQLMTAMSVMLEAEEADSSCRKVRVMKMQYSIVQAWVKRGRGEQALDAVGILLDKAAAE